MAGKRTIAPLSLAPDKKAAAAGRKAPAGKKAAAPEGIRWRALLDGGSAALGLLGEQGEFVYASAALARLFGRPAKQLAGRPLSALVREEDRAGALEALRRCLDSDASATFTARPASGAEPVRWVEATISNRLADGALRALVVHVRDLTAQRELEERHAAIFSIAPVGIAQLGTDRHIQHVNDRLCEILAFERGELVGRRLRDFSHPDDNETTQSAVAELIRNAASTSSLEKRFIRGDGKVVWTRLTMTNPGDERFALHRVVVIEDITARRQAEERLDKLSQLHLAASEINEAILHTRLPRELLQDVCRIIVKHCGFETVTVRLMNEATGMLDVAACAGPLSEWMKSHTREGIPMDRPDAGWLAPAAFRSGRPCITNDRAQDGRFFGCNSPGERAGLRSAAAFPLKRAGQSIGLLLAGSREKELFDDGLTGLVEHIADNVSYALEKIDQESEQERAEQALRESEARFRALVELSSDVYWEQDDQYRFIRVAESNVTSHLSRRDVLKKRRWELPGAEPVSGTWADHIAGLEARLPYRNFEYRHLRTADGSAAYISANGEPIFDAEGRFAGYRGTAKDITAAKRHEWALRRFRTALDQSSELVLLIEGGTGRIIDFNDSVCHSLGYSREELVGQTLDKIVVGSTERQVRERNKALLEAPAGRDQIRRVYRRKDGSTFEVEVVRQAMVSPEGSIIVAIGRDLTQRLAAERRVLESEERFRQLVENIPQVFWIVDTKTRKLLYISPDHARLLGRPLPEEPSAQNWLELVHPEDRGRIERALSSIGASGYDEQYRVVWPDGSVHWVHSRAFPIRNEAGEIVRTAGIAEDVTETRLAERRVRQQARHEQCIARFGRIALAEKDLDRLMAAAVRSVESGLGTADVMLYELGSDERLLVRASAGASPAAGVQAEAAPGLLRVVAAIEGAGCFQGETREAAHRIMPAAWTVGGASIVACVVRAGKNACFVVAAMSPEENAFSPEEAGFLEAISSLISTALQRNESESRLAYLAQFDTVTGLANRSVLRDRLAQIVAQAKRQRWSVGVLFIDLDRFKLVNDTLGHAIGDELLSQTSQRLQACVREADTVGRISGDEFALVLADLGRPDDAALVARKVLETLIAPFQLGAHETFVSASVGIAIFPADGEDADALLKNADAAMYRAKEAGRNGYCFFTAEMNLRSQHRLQLASELRRAIERREFRLHYQPKIDLARGTEICGLEALLRWQHPERGLVPPDEFIPVLEETGLIMPVGEWVLREACSQLRRWRDEGIRVVPVAVNLSGRQFRDKELDRLVQDCASAEGVETALIEIEITESHLMENPAAARRILQALRDAGIRISVDDFGTGYSSLSYLTQFPLTALKIDRSFVRDVDTDPNAASIARAIIDMARGLGFITIAEGVENDRQASFLRQFGCDQAQGFLFARPLSAEQAALKLRGQAPPALPAR